ncbi:reverse transcriptase domain-containing protein [Tanacetum coccineum]
MHTHASISKPVEPLPEPERTFIRRLRRQNRRVPYDQRNNPPQHPRIVYPPVLNINYFRHFLNILRNFDPMDDEPMWVADHVVALTLGSAITIPETANEFAIKGKHFDGRTKTNPHKHIHEFLGICDMFKYRDIENEAVRLMMFPLSLTGEAKTWLDELNKGTIETWDELLADKQSGRPSVSLPSNTQPNPKAHNSKAYQPPQYRNEHVNAVFTRSGKSYNPPVNPNDQQNNFETPINFDSDDEDDELTPQTKTQNPKSVKETLLPKPYKPKIPYLQRLRKEKMEAQYGKFLDMIRAVRINVPLIDVLARMPNYGKFLKELISKKHKIEEIYAAFLSDESSAMIQNKVPPKLGDPESFLIPCNFNKIFSCNALADLGASINLMPYSLYAKLSLETLKPTKMSVRLADRSFQYPVGIAENMLVEVGKFTFPADFVILEMVEDSKVLLILGRPFLHTTDAVIRVKQK